MGKTGYLVLENGQIFAGESIGFEADIKGEVVFNTGMVGYPEGFTDPSYFGQILVLTYPLIGNYGVPAANLSAGIISNFESEKAQIRGLIVSEYINNNTHWQSVNSLGVWLKQQKIPVLSGIDTRTLTQLLRDKGVMKGIMTFNRPDKHRGSFYDINKG